MRFFAVITLLCIPIVAQSQSPAERAAERFYASAFLGWQTVTINDASFDSRMAQAGLGVWLWEGIGLEGEFGGSFTDDTVSGLKLDVPAQTMVNLRLESPPSDGYSAFVQLGLARTEVDSRYTTNATAPGRGTLTSSLSGVHLGIGLVLHLNRWLAADAGYSRLIYEDDSGVNLFRFGVRVTPGRFR
jgi:hypothetical protein